MDWIKDFTSRFEHCLELTNLKKTGFHGSVEINFCSGMPMNYNFKLHRKAAKIDGEYTDVRQGKTRYYKDGQLVGEQPKN